MNSASSDLIKRPAERWMLPVLVLDPVRRSTRTIRPVAVFRDQPFKPHQAGMPEQVGTNLALLEWRQVDAVNATCQ